MLIHKLVESWCLQLALGCSIGHRALAIGEWGDSGSWSFSLRAPRVDSLKQNTERHPADWNVREILCIVKNALQNQVQVLAVSYFCLNPSAGNVSVTCNIIGSLGLTNAKSQWMLTFRDKDVFQLGGKQAHEESEVALAQLNQSHRLVRAVGDLVQEEKDLLH